jgi:hypothetical protein
VIKTYYRRRLRTIACLALVSLASVLVTTPVDASAGPATIGSARAGLTASVLPDGSYTVTAQSTGWTFAGSLGHPVTGLTATDGHDTVGAYHEIDFSYQASGSRRSGVRVYQDTPVVLFSTTYLTSAANSAPFPVLSQFPKLPHHLSYQDQPFSTYKFNSANAGDSPRLYFDEQGHGFLVSAASDFPVADTTDANGSIVAGLAPSVGTLPAGFTHRTILVVGNGINDTYRAWGSALMALGGKSPIRGDADPTLDKLGYWTDNGATYYYQYDPTLGYAGTLLAVNKDFASKGIPLGYMQLDSWWYPKGTSNSWQGDAPTSHDHGIPAGGEHIYSAAPALFSQGLAAFHQQLGLPLITHARWVDPSSPYHQQYTMSNEVVTDPKFWDTTMNYLKDNGVTTYEQDWLNEKAKPQDNLTAPTDFLGNMAHAAAADGLTMQYCMALPQDFLQSTLYQNLQTMRTSPDRFDRGKWDSFLYESRLAGALGALPWSDVFMSTETDNLLLSTLSAGPVGVGDPIGKIDAADLMHTVRADGVIVKPDTAIVPTDGTYRADASGTSAPMVATTYTQHTNLRDGYVFAYARSGTQTATFSPATDLGITGQSYVYDYFSGKGTVVPAGGTFSQQVTSGSYDVVAPVGKSGIAFLGDTGNFVSLGVKRISNLSDDGTVHASVAFAANEHSVTLRGYAPHAPKATAANGSVGPVNYDSTTHQFTVTVSTGPAQSASISLIDG